MSQPNENLLDEHLAAENAHNLDRIMATYGTSPLILLNGQRIEGHAAIREFHRSFGFGEGGSFSDVHADERARHRSSDAIVIEQTLTGLHSGTGCSTHRQADVSKSRCVRSTGLTAAECSRPNISMST